MSPHNSARIIVGMVLDRYGPGYLLMAVGLYCHSLAFALAQNFDQLVYSRLALSIVGCGFVIGIRMVAEWFVPEIGLAEGIYGGWATLALRLLLGLSIAAATAFLAVGLTGGLRSP